jgi:hypothetical protein
MCLSKQGAEKESYPLAFVDVLPIHVFFDFALRNGY